MVIRIFIYGSRLKHTLEVKVLNTPNTQGTAPAVVISFTSEVLIKVMRSDFVTRGRLMAFVLSTTINTIVNKYI